VGILDFLSGGKGGALKKTIAKATNKDAQSVDRFRALEQLRDDGSDEAIAGLMRRFGFNYDKSIEDEQEKEWVHDALVEMAAAPADESGSAEEQGGANEEQAAAGKAKVMRGIEGALLSMDSIAYPLKVLGHLASHDEAWPILEKALAANDNEYVRDPSKKIQLIDYLGEGFHDPRAAQALLPYFEDMDETVRFHAVEAILHQRNEEVGREPLLKLLTSTEEQSRRIKIRILDGFAETGWNTHGHKGTVEKLIEEIALDYSIDGKGRIKKPQR
jgi:HEAT repeat protein